MTKNKQRKHNSILFIILLVLLVAYTIALFAPMIWGVFQTMRDSWDFTQDGALDINFSKLTGKNWGIVFSEFKTTLTMLDGTQKTFFIEEMLINSILFSVGRTVANVAAVTIMAYACGRFNYKFSRFLTSMTLVLMSLPIVGSLPSEIAVARALGLYNTMWGIWIMGFAYNSIYFLVMTESFRAIPKDFSDSASVDGASRPRIMFSIMLPMVKNVIGTIGLIQFVTFWSDYQTPLIYLRSYPTLIYGFFMLKYANGELSYLPAKMAACMIVILPITLLFIIFQDKFLGNISMGGLKE